MYCQNCGTEISEGGSFCSECGKPVNVPVQQTASYDSADLESDEPMFSEIHNVYDYLGYKDPIDRLSDCSRENLEAVQYDFVSAGIVEVYDSFDCCF